ncbi:ABC transporter substrate-binding protein [Sedimentibacter hydroxybenzoicus DSM 7310]|uniref:ABC transporter substrate-binding protein n=1 Tax=Sedimentibacter hydroxybenzoicus DSM 7310 TaxID=1123245 RepID=A0A974BKT9_SEDHY|nr:ABC transporter substrate-binding protein [Sedimentibacter hydroxybenzoicus]NYB74495.1 ABC transporter substrate-binding protein [Sedimentibacter hydroxybenzoicus DSM 7310]
MKNIKISVIIIIAIIFLIAFKSIKGLDIIADVKDETVKIGVLLPLTGPAEPTGTKLKYAIEVAEEIINGKHDVDFALGTTEGLPNLNNKKIEFIYTDHKANPETARIEAERLIKEENVAALIGAYHSSATKTASQVAEEYKIPFLAGSSSSASLTNRGYDYFYRIAPNDDMETEFFFEYITYLNKRFDAGIKTIGIVYIDNEYGIHAAEMVDKWLDEKYGEQGFEIAVKVIYSEDLLDIDDGINKIKEANPDVIFQASYIEDVTQFVKKYKENNIVPKAVLNYCGGFQDPVFIDNLGDDGNYFSGSSASMPAIFKNSESENRINEFYKKKSGEDIDGPALEEFSSAMIIADAINTAGSTNGDEIVEVLKTKSFQTPYFISRSIEFNENGQNSQTISFMVQIQDGKYELVWPMEIQEKQPQILNK